jgi:hypothetical protein
VTQTYLGEFSVDILTTPYAKHGPREWALTWIESYGQIEGSHHKAWVLDQVSRILHGTPVVLTQARWARTGEPSLSEYRHTLAEPSAEYLEWVNIIQGDWNDEECCFEYGYDEGLVP